MSTIELLPPLPKQPTLTPLEAAVRIVKNEGGQGGYFIFVGEEQWRWMYTEAVAKAEVDALRRLLRMAFHDGVTRTAAIAKAVCDKTADQHLYGKEADFKGVGARIVTLLEEGLLL
jgi:hypothetical protein